VSLHLVDSADRTLATPTSASWWDADTECTLVVARPADERELWSDYLAGAVHSYRKHGVECALDMDALRSAADTILFFAAVADNGQIVAGVRAKGPLRDADDSHAVIEWAGRPGLAAVRKMINDRAPFGILEMKSAWVIDDRERNRSLTEVLARSGSHSMALLDIQFCMAAAGDYVLNRWKSSGGLVANHIPPTPYPDERYQTKMMWWDRHTFMQHSEPQQIIKMRKESMALVDMFGRDEAALRYGSTS